MLDGTFGGWVTEKKNVQGLANYCCVFAVDDMAKLDQYKRWDFFYMNAFDNLAFLTTKLISVLFELLYEP